MTKRIIRCAGFVLVFALTISYVYRVLSWKDTTGDYQSSVQELYSTGKDMIDVVFMGSSHVYCGITPAVLWEDKGIAAFNMSTSGQDRNATYHFMKELLKTQSPSLIFVDLYGLLFDRHAVEGNVYRNLLSMRYSKNAIDIVNGYVEEGERLDYYLRWPIIHTRYKEVGMYDFYQYPLSVYGRGAYYPFGQSETYDDKGASDIKTVGELDEENRKWLEDLKALSEKEGFTLILFLEPFEIKEEEQLIINAAAKYAEENSIPFYDFNQLDDEIGLDRYADMNDTHHTNAYGAAKVTRYFENEVIAQYDIKDHRGDARYHFWDEDLRYYKNRLAEENIKNTVNVYDYTALAMEVEDLMVILSLDGEFENIIPELANLGILAEDAAMGGKWIYRNGAWTKLMDNTPGRLETVEIDRFTTIIAQYVPDNPDANVLLGRESVINTHDGLNIAIYDTFSKELVGTRSVANN